MEIPTAGFRAQQPDVLVPVKLAYPNTLYIPDLTMTLLSVGSTTYGPLPEQLPTGHTFTFGGERSTLNLKNGIIVPLILNEFKLFEMPVHNIVQTTLLQPQLALSAVASEAKIRAVHEALGHVNFRATCEAMAVPFQDLKCDVCIINKLKKQVLNLPPSNHTATYAGQLLNIDISGPMLKPSTGKARYIVGVMDDYSRVVVILLLLNRANLHLLFPILVNLFLDEGLDLKGLSMNGLSTTWHSDHEFNTAAIAEWMHDKQMKQTFSPPGVPQANPAIERWWLTLYDRIRVQLARSNLEFEHWGRIALHSVYLYNRTPNLLPGHFIPIEKLRGTPMVAAERSLVLTCPPYGAKACVFDKHANRMLPATVDGTFAGIHAASSAYKILVNDVERITVHVKFLPLPTPTRPTIPTDVLLQLVHVDELVMVAGSTGTAGAITSAHAGPVGSASNVEPPNHAEPSSPVLPAPTVEPSSPVTADPVAPTTATTSMPDVDGDDPLLALAMAACHVHAPQLQCGAMSAEVSVLAAAMAISTKEPRSYNEAMRSDMAPRWQQAIDKHEAVLNHYKVYVPILRSQVPRDAFIYRSHYIFAIKYGGNNEVLDHKARLVIDGNMNPTAMKPAEVFAPVVSTTTGYTLIAVAVKQSKVLYVVDFASAFSQADDLKVEDRVYAYRPKGVAYVDERGRELVMEMHKPMFGHPKSPRYWFDTINRVLTIDMQCEQSIFDPCLYRRSNDLLFTLTVDDMLVAAETDHVATLFIEQLSKRFDLSRSGPAHLWLNIALEYDLASGVIHLSQEAYILRVYAELDLLHVPLRNTPMSPTMDLSADLDTLTVLPRDRFKRFQKIVGVSMYLSTTTHKHIVYSTNMIARYMSCP